MFIVYYHLLCLQKRQVSNREQSLFISRPPACCLQYDMAHYAVCIIQVGLTPAYCTILDGHMKIFQVS